MKSIERNVRTIFQLAVLVMSMLLAGVIARAQQFDFTPINVQGANFTSARGVNSAGNIVGTFREVNGGVHGFLLTGFGSSNAVFHTIDFPPSQSPTRTVQQTGARGINDNGDIVGLVLDGNGTQHGFLLTGFPGDPKFYIIDFPQRQSPTGNVTLTFVHSINIHGDIVGYYLDANFMPSPPSFPSHGFKVTGLPGNPQFTQVDFPGALATLAFGINDDGDVVGVYDPNNAFVDQAYLLAGGEFKTLTSPVGQNRAWGINKNGQIVGFFEGGGAGLFRGDLIVGSSFTVILFPNSASTANFGINRAGQIVGQYTSPDGSTHGFLATPASP